MGWPKGKPRKPVRTEHEDGSATTVDASGENSVILHESAPIEPDSNARKAEDWQHEDKSLPWQHFRCRECNNPMFGRMPQSHDICEECGYLIRDQMQQQASKQMQHRSRQFVNPFSDDAFTGTAPLPVLK